MERDADSTILPGDRSLDETQALRPVRDPREESADDDFDDRDLAGERAAGGYPEQHGEDDADEHDDAQTRALHATPYEGGSVGRQPQQPHWDDDPHGRDDLLPLRAHDELPVEFAVVLRGYDRGQVQRYVRRLEAALAETEHDRDVAHADLERATDLLEAARREAEQARLELERGRPAYSEIGGRIGQILTLAEQEANEIRTRAQQEANQLLAAAREEADARVRAAEQERRGAEHEANEMRRMAQLDADRMLREAREQQEQVERAATRRVAAEEQAARRQLVEIERQRDAVRDQLARLRDSLAAAVGTVSGADVETDAPVNAAPPRPTVHISTAPAPAQHDNPGSRRG